MMHVWLVNQRIYTRRIRQTNGCAESTNIKIESGKRDLSFSTIIRAFRAMGISAKLDMGSLGVYAF